MPAHAQSQPTDSRFPGALRRIAASRSARGAGRTAALAGLIGIAFAVAVHSSSQGHEHDLLREALGRGADRLADLQSPDGAWARTVGGRPDLRQTGQQGRALLAAWQITREQRHLNAARAAARAVANAVRRGEATSTANLLFLAEMSHVTGQPALLRAADADWLRRYQTDAPDDGALAARQFLQTPNASRSDDGSWRNYLLVRASEEADLARLLGHEAWADAYLLEAAGAWSPKHDHEYWASAAGGMLGALSRSGDPRARRFELAHRGLLEANEIVPGLSWNDTPYDTYVYTAETAASLAGRAANERVVGEGSPTFWGLEFLASRQAPHGGWGEVVSLLDDVSEHGDDEVPPAADALGETPGLDAQVVRTLALALGARG